MFTINLRCDNGHSFQGWYDLSDNFEQRFSAGDVSCPMCGTCDVKKNHRSEGLLSVRRAFEQSIDIQKAMTRLLHRVRQAQENREFDLDPGTDDEGLPYFKLSANDFENN